MSDPEEKKSNPLLVVGVIAIILLIVINSIAIIYFIIQPTEEQGEPDIQFDPTKMLIEASPTYSVCWFYCAVTNHGTASGELPYSVETTFYIDGIEAEGYTKDRSKEKLGPGESYIFRFKYDVFLEEGSNVSILIIAYAENAIIDTYTWETVYYGPQ